jgi:DNA gyrase/topoisomerase IV subunit A
MSEQPALDFSAPPPPESPEAPGLGSYAQRAYLEYALSVVKGRALPDVCDGQKPVQRRILYAMSRMGLSFGGANGNTGAKPVKSARVVGDVLGKFHPHGDQSAYDALDCGVEVVGISIPRLRPPGPEGGKFEELSIARQNGRRQIEAAQSTVNSTLSMIIGDVDRAGNLVKGIAQLQELESNFARTKDAAIRAEADALQARLEQMVLDSRAQAATVISSARARRWSTLMDAQTIAQEVLSQASAWDVDPGLFQTRKTMQVLGEALADVRVKYMLLPDPARVRVDIEMQEPTTGLNLGDYLEKKTDETTEE